MVLLNFYDILVVMDMLSNLQGWLKIIYVGFAFCLAFFLGALKGFLLLFTFYKCLISAFLFFFSCLTFCFVMFIELLHGDLKDGFFFFINAAGLLVCPVAGLILIIGNVGVIIGLFPAHVAWTVYTLVK